MFQIRKWTVYFLLTSAQNAVSPYSMRLLTKSGGGGKLALWVCSYRNFNELTIAKINNRRATMRKFTKRVVSTFITGMLVCGMAAGAPVASVHADEGEEVAVSTETDAEDLSGYKSKEEMTIENEEEPLYKDDSSDTFQYDIFECKYISDDQIEIIGLVPDTEVTDIIIPDEIEGAKVVSIGTYAFLNCKDIVKVTMPDSITSIGQYVFSGCENLKEIVFSAGLKKIGSYVILNSGVENVDIPSGVEYITDSAFWGAHNLKSVTIPDTVVSIHEDSFVLCENLESIVVSEDNTVFDSRGNCNAIIDSKTNTLLHGCKSTVIPDTVTSIGDAAFCDSGIEEITIPKSVSSIGRGVFTRCSHLETINVDEDNNVYDSRDNCNAIIETNTNKLIRGTSSTVIPSTVTELNENSFSGLSNLKSLVIPDGVTSIGAGAFSFCFNLEKVVIPDSVNSISRDSFINISALWEICCPDLILYGNAGSYVEQYANENKIPFANLNFTGFLKVNDNWVYLKNGEKATDFTGPVSGTVDGTKAWYYVKDGKVDFDYSDFAKVGSSWMYFSNGKVDKTINADHYGSFWGTVNGKGGWYVVKAGKAYSDYSGFALVGSSWMQYKNGQVDKSYTGTLNVNINGTKKWYYINKGKAILDYTGFGKVGSSWMRFKNGEINKTVTGIISGTVNGTKAQWYVKSGKVQLTYSGTYKKNGKTYTIKNGKVTKVS